MMNTKTLPTIQNDPGAKTWEYQTHGAVVVERNRYFIGMIAAILIAAGSVFTVGMLLPLEKLVPMVVTVDSRTGLITSVEYSKSLTDLTQKEAVQAADVRKYVVARETYDPQDFTTNGRIVRVMSDSPVAQQYDNEVSTYNQRSPQNRYGNKTRRRIEVITVLPLPGSSNTYQVRFRAIEEYQGGGQYQPVEAYYTATVSFRYSNRDMSNEDRLLNALNFRATAYRADLEITPQTQKGVVQSTTPP